MNLCLKAWTYSIIIVYSTDRNTIPIENTVFRRWNMKTLKELYDEILASDELKKEFAGCAANEQDTAAFLEKYGCDATVEEDRKSVV